jgi:hypothetical protein
MAGALLWKQGLLRHTHEDIIEAALRDWRAGLTLMGDGPFYFGDEPTSVDAIVFGALATTVLTPIGSRSALRSQPACVAYAERMRARFFPEFAVVPGRRPPRRRRARRVPCRAAPDVRLASEHDERLPVLRSHDRSASHPEARPTKPSALFQTR